MDKLQLYKNVLTIDPNDKYLQSGHYDILAGKINELIDENEKLKEAIRYLAGCLADEELIQSFPNLVLKINEILN